MPQVYCIIPGVHLHETKEKLRVIKIGRSGLSWLERLRSYGNNSTLLVVREVNNDIITERILVDKFKARCNNFKGREFFWCEPEIAMKLFDEVTLGLNNINPVNPVNPVIINPNAMDIDYDIIFT